MSERHWPTNLKTCLQNAAKRAGHVNKSRFKTCSKRTFKTRTETRHCEFSRGVAPWTAKLTVRLGGVTNRCKGFSISSSETLKTQIQNVAVVSDMSTKCSPARTRNAVQKCSKRNSKRDNMKFVLERKTPKRRSGTPKRVLRTLRF